MHCMNGSAETSLRRIICSPTLADEVDYEAATAPLWSYLDQLKPLLWRRGRAFPENAAAQRSLLSGREISIAISFNPAEATSATGGWRRGRRACFQVAAGAVLQLLIVLAGLALWRGLEMAAVRLGNAAAVGGSRHARDRTLEALEQDGTRHGLQTRPGGREDLAAPRRPQPVAEADPRSKVHRRYRSRQATTSSRRLTHTVTKNRQ